MMMMIRSMSMMNRIPLLVFIVLVTLVSITLAFTPNAPSFVSRHIGLEVIDDENNDDSNTALKMSSQRSNETASSSSSSVANSTERVSIVDEDDDDHEEEMKEKELEEEVAKLEQSIDTKTFEAEMEMELEALNSEVKREKRKRRKKNKKKKIETDVVMNNDTATLDDSTDIPMLSQPQPQQQQQQDDNDDNNDNNEIVEKIQQKQHDLVEASFPSLSAIMEDETFFENDDSDDSDMNQEDKELTQLYQDYLKMNNIKSNDHKELRKFYQDFLKTDSYANHQSKYKIINDEIELDEEEEEEERDLVETKEEDENDNDRFFVDSFSGGVKYEQNEDNDERQVEARENFSQMDDFGDDAIGKTLQGQQLDDEFSDVDVDVDTIDRSDSFQQLDEYDSETINVDTVDESNKYVVDSFTDKIELETEDEEEDEEEQSFPLGSDIINAPDRNDLTPEEEAALKEKEEIFSRYDKFFEEHLVATEITEVTDREDKEIDESTMESVTQILEKDFPSTQEADKTTDEGNINQDTGRSSGASSLEEEELLMGKSEEPEPSITDESNFPNHDSLGQKESLKEVSFASTKATKEPVMSKLSTDIDDQDKDTGMPEKCTKKNPMDRFSFSDSLLQQIQNPKKNVKVNVPKLDLKMPKMNLPKIDEKQVEHAIVTTKKGFETFLDGLAFLTKESVDFAVDIKNNMDTMTVGGSTTTYEEAFEKVATGAKGVTKLFGIGFGLMKDSVAFVATEIKTKNEQASLTSKTKRAAREQSPVPKPPKLPPPTKSEYLEKDLPSQASLQSRRDFQIDSPSIFSEQVVSKPKPVSTPRPVSTSLDGQLGEIKSKATSFWNNVRSSATSAVDDVAFKAGENVETARLSTEKQVEDVKSKAKAMFGDILSNAENFMDDVKFKSTGELKKGSVRKEKTTTKFNNLTSSPKLIFAGKIRDPKDESVPSKKKGTNTTKKSTQPLPFYARKKKND